MTAAAGDGQPPTWWRPWMGWVLTVCILALLVAIAVVIVAVTLWLTESLAAEWVPS